MYIKNFEKKYQEKWENAYLRVKNARASRALMRALDPGQYWLALLARLHFTSSAKSQENFLAPPWPNPGSATVITLTSVCAGLLWFRFCCDINSTAKLSFLILEDRKSFLWGHWYPCFGLLVTSVLGFKARVDFLLVCSLTYMSLGSPLVRPLLTSWRKVIVFSLELSNVKHSEHEFNRLQIKIRVVSKRGDGPLEPLLERQSTF